MAKKDSDWEESLAKDAAKERAREKAGGGGLGNKLSIKGRRFTFGGENIGRTLKGVVIDFVYLSTFYSGKYKEDAANIPSCFALSEDGEDTVPHENVKKPQSDACDGCPKNEWGSADKGRGKACQGRRRLAIIHEDDLEELDDKTQIAFLEMPVTSVKNWSKFISECTDKLNRPFYTVKVELSFDEDEDYPVLQFAVDEKIKDRDTVAAIKDLREKVREDLMTPYDTTSDADDDDDEDEKPKKGKSKKSKSDDDDDEDEKPAKKKRKSKEDDDDEDEDEKPAKRKGKGKADDDDEVEDDDEDDEDDEKPSKGKKGKNASRGKSRDEDADSDDDDDDDEDDKPSRSSRNKKAKDDEDDDDDEPKPKKKSRFGGK